MNNCLYYIFKILSYSPLFRVTDDDRFNEITKNHSKLRLSLLSFNLGIKSYHIISYNFSEQNFKFLFVLNLYDVVNYYEKIVKNGDDYDDYLKELSKEGDKNKSIEKEFILYKISEEMNTKNRTFNKFLAYLAIIALIIPLYASKLTNLTSYTGKLPYKIIFAILLIYCFVNLLYLMHSFIRIKGYKRTLFNSLRKSKQPDSLVNALLYYEMKNKAVESNMEISIIKNLEKYIILIISISSLVLIFSNIETWKSNNEKHYVEKNKSSEYRSILLNSEVNSNMFIKANKDKIEDVNNDIISGEFKKVLIISNDNNNEIQADLKKIFEIYKSREVEVISITDNDLSDKFQIILLEE